MSGAGPRVLLLAPVCWDDVIVHGSRTARAGGSGLFAALALARLGAAVSLHTSIAHDDEGLLRALASERISVIPHPSRRTTRFEIEIEPQDPNRRRIRLRASADPLDAARVDPAGCGYALVAPLLPGDLDAGLLASLAGRGLPVDLGVQGLCRRVSPDGSIEIARPDPVRVPRLRVVAGDEAEIATTPEEILDAAGEIVTTLGDRGARIEVRRPSPRQIEIPAIPVGGPAREPIGLGDTFLAVYGWMRIRGHDPREAGQEAARRAAALLERGLPPLA